MKEQECVNGSMGQDSLIEIVTRVKPREYDQKDLLQIVERVPLDGLHEIVERVKLQEPDQRDLLPPLVEAKNSKVSILAICSDGVKPIRDEEVNLNFARKASSADQITEKYKMIKIDQAVLPIIKMESQDGVKEKRIPAMKIARWLAERYQFCTYEDSIYVFDTNHYKVCNSKTLEQIIYSSFKRSDFIPSGYKFLQDVRNFLILETMSRKFTLGDVEYAQKYIGFKNGYLNVDTLKFIDPNPAIFITNYLEVDYDHCLFGNNSVRDLKQIHCPHFDQFISNLADDNLQIFYRIYEMIGYILSNDCSAKKLFVLAGVPDSGKSKLGKFISMLFNEGAVVAIPIGDLGERFSLGDLPGKALCVDLDLPATQIKSKTAAKIKSLTGGDPISAENKFEHKKTFINRAKLLFATNHQIEIDEKEYVLKNRFVCIPITRSVPKEKQCSNLLDYFEAEKFFIVMKSIGYYRELVRKNYEFTGDFSFDSAFIRNSNGIAMPLEDMINRFVTEKCLFVSKEYCFTDTLYKEFCNYYEIPDRDGDYRNFSNILKRLYSDKWRRQRKDVIIR